MVNDSTSSGSLINTSFGTAGGTAAPAAGAGSIPGSGSGAAGLGSGLIPASRGSCIAAVAGARDGAGAGSEVDDFKQLAEVLACSRNKWLREKAAAAVEQLAADDVQACRWGCHWLVGKRSCIGSSTCMV